jgi:hypothetical protein
MNAVGLLIIGVVVLIVLYFVPKMPPPLYVVLSIIGWCAVAVGGILIVLGMLGVPAPGPRLTSVVYALQTAVERPGAVPSNPMDANAIALIGVPVVALTQLSKWANLPDQWGPAAVLVFAAIGVAVWVASYGGFHTQDLFNYFVAWITTAVASAGVFGFTRAAAAAVTSATPPPRSGAGSEPVLQR